MAVTRIWAVRNNLSQVVDYASNKSKTDLSKYSDLIDALHYAADEEKTTLENEKKLLVEGINCDPDIAARQMIDTKEIYGKTDGVVLITHMFLSSPVKFHPKKHSRLQWKLQIKCGARITK